MRTRVMAFVGAAVAGVLMTAPKALAQG